ncbi:methyltransferase domain-containing protein [Curtobacterium sp. 9128]|uniref:methyltransferase domain-containing protein n=1 Tax=Curtobacterium sp. 9128 TaxID=1793722 RepID=UPI0011A60978|nr:methyltransferase domain-containing protein [Curtobacterium sp. 9128]
MTTGDRRPEPVFVRAVRTALGPARTVLVVGGGTVPYDPADRDVTVVEPVQDLPFPDGAFDAALTAFSVHAWAEPEHGLAELRRVTSGPVVVLTRDPDRVRAHWLAEYAPDVVAADAGRLPAVDRIAAALGGDVTTTPLPVPFTCVDGFAEAYYGRPERLLDAGVRKTDPAWALVDEMTAARSVAALRSALERGAWDDRHGRLRVSPSHEGSVVLVTATPTLGA